MGGLANVDVIRGVAIKTVSIRRRVFMRTVVVFNQTKKFRAFCSLPTCLVTIDGGNAFSSFERIS